MRSLVFDAVRLVAVSAATLAACAGGVASAATVAGDGATAEAAVEMLERGEVVRARTLLRELASVTSSTAERAELLDLLERADRAMRGLSSAEVRIQRAQVMVDRGELRDAERTLEHVRGDMNTGVSERARATEMLDEIARSRVALAPVAASVIAQAELDFERGDWSAAKAGFEAVRNSGVSLTRDQQRSVRAHTDRIAEIERRQGSSFETETVSLGVFAASRAVAGGAVSQDGGDGGGDESNGAIFDEADQAAARQTLEMADRAFEAGQYIRAEQLYAEILTGDVARFFSTDELESAASRRSEAAQLAGRPTQGNAANDFRAVLERVRDQTGAEVESLLDDVRDGLARGDVDGARQSLAEARVRWEESFSDGFFNEAENQDQQGEFDELRARIDSEAQRIEIQERLEAEQERADAVARREGDAQAEREQTITNSLRQVRQLQHEQKYEEALEVIERILLLDPNNDAAALLKPTIENVVIYRSYLETRRDKNLAIARELSEIERAKVIPDRVISYPEDWPQLSETRQLYSSADDFTQSPRDAAVLATLERVNLPANFDGVPLENVVEYVASLTNVNVDPDWDSLSFMGIERDTEVDLDLAREISARTLLDRVVEKVSPDEIERAGWQVQDGIVIIASQEDLNENNFIVLYDVRDLVYEIPDFDNAPDLDLNNILGGGGGGGGGGDSPFEDDDDDDDDTSLGFGEEEQDNLDELIDIITGAVHGIDVPDYWLIQDFNDNLVITATANDHRRTRDLLRQLREVKNIQITLETRFLTVETGFFEQIGFDVDIAFNVQDSDSVQAIRQQVGAQQLPIPGAGASLLPDSVIDATTGLPVQPGQAGSTNVFVDGDGDPTTFDPVPAAVPFIVPTTSGLSAVNAPSNSLNIAEAVFGNSAVIGDLVGAPALSVAGTFLDDIQVDFLIEATQADERSVLLQAPRLTFTNGKQANVFVGVQQGFVSDQTPIVGTGAIGFDPTIQTLTDGFTLNAAGVVSADRRFVTLGIEVEFAGPTSFTSQTVTGVAGGADGGSGSEEPAQASIDIPNRAITSVSTGVTVPDRGTIMLGGQRIATELEVETGVPVLSKMPVINRFFTNRITETTEQTLMILAKPTIILQREEEDLNFPGLRERLEGDL